MNEKLKRLVECCIIIILLGFTIHFLNILLRPVNTDNAYRAIDTFHSLEENSIEVIGYGSSHMWRGLNVMEMYKNYGIGAYNYGCNWQHINTTSLFFHDSLRTQSPKIVLIETFFINDLLKDTNINGEIYYTRAIPDSKEKEKYLKQCFGDSKERYLSYYLPLYAFHDNWVNISKESFQKNSNSYDFKKNMGYYYNDDTIPITIKDSSEYQQLSLSQDAKDVLDDIIRICKKKNIQVIFFTIPHSEGNPYHDAISQYAEENQCSYIDLFDSIEEIGIDLDSDFADVGHLNNKGADKVGQFMGKYISENYQYQDMKTVKNNMWEKNISS